MLKRGADAVVPGNAWSIDLKQPARICSCQHSQLTLLVSVSLFLRR